MKKIFSVFTAAILFATSFTSCQSDAEKRAEAELKKAKDQINDASAMPVPMSVSTFMNEISEVVHKSQEFHLTKPGNVRITAIIDGPFLSPDKVRVLIGDQKAWVKFNGSNSDFSEYFYNQAYDINQALVKGKKVSVVLENQDSCYVIYDAIIDEKTFPISHPDMGSGISVKIKSAPEKQVAKKANTEPVYVTQVTNNSTSNYYITNVELVELREDSLGVPSDGIQ